MIIDLGTGDGLAVIDRASGEPRALVIGIDASASAMAESSRRAERGRSRLDNAIFLVEAVEALPGPLARAASLVTITMPWGSLLRGVLGLDPSVLRGIASVVGVGGRIEVLASAQRADRVEGMTSLGMTTRPSIDAAWRREGFELVDLRLATAAELVASRSSWARRLGDREVWRLELRRPR